MDYLNCYICNSETTLQKSVRIRSKTKHSGVGVNEIIQSFLKESHSLRFSPNDIVCERCFQKINQYDLACRMADEIQQDITNALFATEQQYMSQEPVEFLEDEVRYDKSSCRKEFEAFQEQYSLRNELGKDNSEGESTETMHNLSGIDSSIDDEDSLKTISSQSSKTVKQKNDVGCEDCDMTFNTRKELKQHQLRYHTQKKCGVCQKMFANQMELKNHVRQNHEIEPSSNDEAESRAGDIFGEGDNSLRCEICGFIEATAESLANHVALHENKLKCVICNTVLKHRANLVLHMRIHADKKFFKCDKRDCEKTFVHKSSLRMHLQTTHTEVRNKQCPECPLKFKTTSQLNQHMVTHTGIKSHKCPLCGKAFGQKYNMTAHYKGHFTDKSEKRARTRTRTRTEPASSACSEVEM